MRFRKLVKRLALGVVVVFAAAIIAATSYRAYRQHQLADTLVISSANGINEQHFVEANGIEHWVTIRGVDRRNPIVFFVHGGPAEIVSFVPSATQALERDFTVVHWDQRGAGRTFSRNSKPPADLALAQMTDDGIKVVEWVTRHLGQPQVIVVGHSWGSILGEHMVFARPDLFAAYVGTGQVVGWKAQVQVQYADSVARARADADSDVLAALATFGGPPSTDLGKYQEFRAVTFRYHAPADLEFFSRQASDLLTAPGVSLADVWNALQGARASMAALTPTLLSTDLTELGYDFPVPFVVIQGDSDRITPTSLAVDYFSRINAPAKALVQIPDAGHYAFVTHANQFRDALVSKVLPVIRRDTSP